MTEQNIELLQQRIFHLEKLADDAGKTLTFQQSRIDLLTAERAAMQSFGNSEQLKADPLRTGE